MANSSCFCFMDNVVHLYVFSRISSRTPSLLLIRGDLGGIFSKLSRPIGYTTSFPIWPKLVAPCWFLVWLLSFTRIMAYNYDT